MRRPSMSDHAGDSDKPNMPPVLKELGEKAIRRHEQRSGTPALKVESAEGNGGLGMRPQRIILTFSSWGLKAVG